MKNIKYLSMAALVVMGAIIASCEKIEQSADPIAEDNIEVCTTTINMGTDGTKALAPDGTKTFAVNETMAIVYKNTSGNTVKAVSAALTDSDIESGNTSATFTFDLTNPDKTAAVTYIYPAAMAKDDGDINYDALASQDGTLETLAGNLDLATYTGAWVGGTSLPSGTLVNQLAILAIKLKNSSEITSSITGMTLNDGTNNYAITRSAGAGPIYVAIHPTDGASLFITATDGTNNYVKYLTGKTYEKGNGYPVTWLMTTSVFTVGMDGSTPKKVYFSRGNVQVTYDGYSCTWSLAEHQWDCIGNAWGNTVVRYGTLAQENTTADLFGWVGASSSLSGAEAYGLTWRTSGYGNSDTEGLKSDWGTKFGSGWRTLTKDEWSYLFGTRQSGSSVNGVSDARYTYATVHGVHGVILFPDNVTIEHSEIDSWGSINDRSSWATIPTNGQWAALAAKGCVFLPAAGYRGDNSVVHNVGDGGYYWSASSVAGNANQAYSVFLKANNQGFAAADDRFYGFSVRLVRDVE